MAEPVLRVRGVTKHFGLSSGLPFLRRQGVIQALENVSFDLGAGETLGIVGESGSGKSTLARTLMLLERPTAGQALYEGRDIFTMAPAEVRALRREIQMVFQDPWASLNPRRTICDAISEGWVVHPGIVAPQEHRRRVAELLDLVGLNPSALDNYPSEFSGGQRQRISIARALALNPSVLILDEAVSALDVSVQAQVLNLLVAIQKRLGIAYIFISHDLAVVRHLAQRVGVMYMGRMAEIGPASALYDRPTHPYTQALLSAMPADDDDGGGERIILEGEVPNPAEPPSGCRFRTRCWRAAAVCADQEPELADADERDLRVACHFPTRGSGAASTIPSRPELTPLPRGLS